MESRIAQAIRMELAPVAVLFSDERPTDAMQFAEGRWGCVMWLLATAARGKPAAADRATFGCLGGGTGLGFGNQDENWPGTSPGGTATLRCSARPGGERLPFLTDTAGGRPARRRARATLRRAD